jgi:hypothetical protein
MNRQDALTAVVLAMAFLAAAGCTTAPSVLPEIFLDVWASAEHTF